MAPILGGSANGVGVLGSQLISVDDMEEYEEEDEDDEDDADEAEQDSDEDNAAAPDDGVDVGASGEDKLAPVTEKDTDV